MISCSARLVQGCWRGPERSTTQTATASTKPGTARISRALRHDRPSQPISSVATTSEAHAPPARPRAVTVPCTEVRMASGNQVRVTWPSTG